jgi:hypothetical protein
VVKLVTANLDERWGKMVAITKKKWSYFELENVKVIRRPGLALEE